MEIFLVFLLTCFFGGFLLPKVPLGRLTLLLAGLCAMMLVGYFFFFRLI